MADASRPAAYLHNGRPVSAGMFYAIACDPRRNVAVEACAGSGKTWMLVSRILRALLDSVDPGTGSLRMSPHEILAITFTRRAASEMRERLYSWLEDFAQAPQARLLEELRVRGVAVDPDPQVARVQALRLSGLYRSVLASGRQVQVRTFHSWFAALLRSAPLSLLEQLQLPLDYELLEDDTPATAQVWRRFYQALLERPREKADYEALVLVHGRTQTEKALAGALDKRTEFALADAAGVAEGSVQHFSALFPALAALDEPAASLLLPATRSRWLAWAQALERESNKTPRKAAQMVVDGFAAAGALAAPDACALLAVLRKALFVADENRLTHHLRKFSAAQQAEAELQVLCAAQHQHQAWCYQQRMVRLTRVLLGEYVALKRERGWVDMTDVERAARVLLSDPVLSGWVQERLDARVSHLLIDEFQDTNPLQWQSLLSWLQGYAGAGGAAPSVFLVGDPKQSIYRFRRAEPQVFLAAQQFVLQGLQGELLGCDHTRRNAGAVISLVNAAMGRARDEDGFDAFRDHTTGATAIGQVGRLPPIPRADAVNSASAGQPDSAADGFIWRDSLSTPRVEPEETLRNLEARQVARWIRRQVDAGLPPRDVMVLSRRRAGLLPMQEELRALQVPAQIGEKVSLIDCCEVQDIVALLDVLVSTQHDLSLARVLRSPLFGLPDTALVALALRRRVQERPWFELLQQPWPASEPLHGIGATLQRWKEWVDRLPPHDALQLVYDDGDVLARFAVAAPATQRPAVLANLRALLSAALELGGGRYASPYAFVRALKAGGVLAPAAVSQDAVRLLTIHGAKGLESETVVLLDTDTPERSGETMGVLVDWPGEAPRPHKLVFLASEAAPPGCAVALLEAEQEQRQREELNALYVALTRARQTLLASSIVPHRAAPQSWWQRLAVLTDEMDAYARGGPGPVVDRADAEFAITILPELPGIAPPANTGPAQPMPLPQDDTPQARIGRAMHRLLEWGDASPQQCAAAARDFMLDAGQAEQAAAGARSILQGQGAWSWDMAQVDWQGAEIELVYLGQVLRLDRLVRHRHTGHWWVLDFKSAATPQDRHELVAQLRSYRDAVQAIYPGDTVRAAFLTAQGALVEHVEVAGNG